MSAHPYETVETLVPRSWAKRMDKLAARHGVDRDAIVARAVKAFLLDHKQMKGTKHGNK